MDTLITRLELGSGLLSVNAYLIKSGSGFVLVDTGMRRYRARLDRRLGELGCTAESLRLVIITHGDADHIGNAAHLRKALDAPIAMHPADAPMATAGDMFAGRKRPGWLARTILPLFARVREADRYEPDALLGEETDLTDYGLPGAHVLLLGGHSSGSIALLLPDGSLFCGDVLENRSTPKLGSIMDDVPVARASVERLRTLPVTTVYPGHGAPFRFSELRVTVGEA